MSEVFLARRADGRRVALKRLFPIASADGDLRAAITEEAKRVQALAHPGIVRVFGTGTVERAFFVEYELVEGRDLATVIDRARARKVKPTIPVALSVILPVLRALAHVHKGADGQRPLVHRDVAPSNVLVGFDGTVKLTDFGIAHEAGRAHKRTQEGMVKGTARYMSPEQARGVELDASSDLFSLGCVLAELLIGAPLRSSGGQAAISEIAAGRVDLGALEANAPPKLRAILFKLLAQSRGERYSRGEQCIEELEDFCRRSKLSVGPSTVAEFMANLFAATIPETLPESSVRGSAPNAGPSTIPQHSEESLTMADEKGGSDLDVFEGLAKKSNRSSVSAVPPPPGPASKRATTLLGVAAPPSIAKLDVPPPPSAPPASKAPPPPPPPGGRPSAPPAPPPASMRSPTSTPLPAPPTSKAPPPPPPKPGSAPPPPGAPPPPPGAPSASAAPPPPPAKGGTLMMDSKELAGGVNVTAPIASSIHATIPMDTTADKPPPPPTTLIAAVAPPPKAPQSIGAALGLPAGAESAEDATPTHGKKGKKRGAKVDMDWEDDEESTHVFEQKQHALPLPSSPKKADAARVDAKSAALIAGSGSSARPISQLPPPPAVPAPLPIPAPTMPRMIAQEPAPAAPTRAVAMEDRPTPLPMPRQQASSSGRIAIILGALALVAVLGLGAYILVGGSAPSTGSLRIEVKSKAGASIAKAEISIDGVKKCDATPCVATDIKPGRKSITVVIAGSVNGTNADAIVEAGKENFVAVTIDDAPALPPTTPPTTPPTAVAQTPKGTGITVAGPSGMKVLVDGKEVGTTSKDKPLTLSDLKPGSHQVKFDGGPDYESVTKPVDVKQDTLTDLGEIKLKVLIGHLKLDLKTAGAKVVLKSKGKPDKPLTDEILKSDLAINIDTKQTWTIVATKANFDDFTQEITFDDGAAEKTLAIELNEKGKPPVVPNPLGSSTTSTPPVMTSTSPTNPPDAMGTIAIGSIPPANALVDGAPAGKTPTSKKVAPGSHTVVFVFPSGSRKSVTVTVKAGETKSASARDN